MHPLEGFRAFGRIVVGDSMALQTLAASCEYSGCDDVAQLELSAKMSAAFAIGAAGGLQSWRSPGGPAWQQQPGS